MVASGEVPGGFLGMTWGKPGEGGLRRLSSGILRRARSQWGGEKSLVIIANTGKLVLVLKKADGQRKKRGGCGGNGG